MKKVYRIFFLSQGSVWDAAWNDLLPHDINFDTYEDAEFHLASWWDGMRNKTLSYLILAIYKEG